MVKKSLFYSFLLISFLTVYSFAEEKNYYPEKYRGWFHVKSMVIEKGHPLYDAFGGIHHIYANKTALKALKDKKTYPNGSTFVFDLLDAKIENNAIVEGERKVIGVMIKDSKKFKDTGGWGFFAYKGDTKEQIVKDMKSACFECHSAQKDSDYIFSTYRK